ncbi:hypothetical protein BJV82DRAFT_711308 [Fennellomyces sp. T-0311]|nr:hypothetical protein BJV82DRAFT_711308 [Fennellomyces sp. T-0311]
MFAFDRAIEQDVAPENSDSAGSEPEYVEDQFKRHIDTLNKIRQEAAHAIAQSQENQKRAIEKKLFSKRKHLKVPPFEINDELLREILPSDTPTTDEARTLEYLEVELLLQRLGIYEQIHKQIKQIRKYIASKAAQLMFNHPRFRNTVDHADNRMRRLILCDMMDENNTAQLPMMNSNHGFSRALSESIEMELLRRRQSQSPQ